MSHSTPSKTSTSHLETRASGGASAYLVSRLLTLVQSLRDRRASLSSIILSKQKSSGGKPVLPPMSNQEKPWSRRSVQCKCDTKTHYWQIQDDFINSSDTDGFIRATSVKLQDYSFRIIPCLRTYHTISKHFSFLIPTNTFGRPHQSFTFGKNKSFHAAFSLEVIQDQPKKDTQHVKKFLGKEANSRTDLKGFIS